LPFGVRRLWLLYSPPYPPAADVFKAGCQPQVDGAVCISAQRQRDKIKGIHLRRSAPPPSRQVGMKHTAEDKTATSPPNQEESLTAVKGKIPRCGDLARNDKIVRLLFCIGLGAYAEITIHGGTLFFLSFRMFPIAIGIRNEKSCLLVFVVYGCYTPRLIRPQRMCSRRGVNRRLTGRSVFRPKGREAKSKASTSGAPRHLRPDRSG
jgi:hypothetical protein